MNIPKPATRPNNIRLLHLIAFFGALYFYLPILTLFLQERGLSLLQVNSLWGIIVGTMFLAEVPTGVLADRMGRKRSIVVALGLQLLGELIFIFADRYWLFALSSITGGLGFAFSSGAFEALLFDSLKQVGQEKRMAEVSGLNAAFKQAAFVIGALASGLIAPELTPSRFILLISLTALSVLLAVLVSLFLHEPAPSMDQPPPNSLQLLNQGLHQLRSSVPLQKIILLTILGKPFLDYLTNLYQPYFVERQVAPIWLGITFALGSLAAMLAARYAYRLVDIFGDRYAILLANGLPGIFYLLMAALSQPAAIVPVVILAGGSMNLREPLLAHARNLHLESESRATVLSLISMLVGLYTALMGLVIGWLADQGLGLAFGFIAAIVLASTLWFRLGGDG